MNLIQKRYQIRAKAKILGILLCFALRFLLLQCAVATASPGDLDNAFNSPHGFVIYDETSEQAKAAAVQADGKIIVAGWGQGYTDILLLRYNTDGTLDRGFGDSGKVVYHSAWENGWSVAIQPDGKIIVVGARSDPDPESDSDAILLRYNSDGTPDVSFGANGAVIYDGRLIEESDSVALQRNGKIVSAGFTYDGTNCNVLLMRHNVDGTLDGTFGIDGVVTYDGGDLDVGSCVGIQPDGKILVAGWTRTTSLDVLLIRYNENGTLDSGFGLNGVLTYDGGFSETGHSMTMQQDGKILVAGGISDGANYDVLAIRYNPDGTVDSTFGANGVVRFDSGLDDFGVSITTQTNGKIVIAGSKANETKYNSLLLRYNTDGTPDATFGTNGVVSYDSGFSDTVHSVTIQPDGKIVAAGTVFDGNDYDVLVLRYMGDPIEQPDPPPNPPPSSDPAPSLPPSSDPAPSLPPNESVIPVSSDGHGGGCFIESLTYGFRLAR